jgi:hypothetical protein
MQKRKNPMPPPFLPNAFNNQYELQVDHATFCRAFKWATGGSGNKRILQLLGMPDAPYSTPAERQATPDPLRIRQAIDYLFATATGLPRPDGILRYRPFNGITFCNIFVNDVTRILHAEIPNSPPNTSVGQMRRWLEQNGAANGWQELVSIEGDQAQDFVNTGHVAVMLWSRDEVSDHVALVRPGNAKVDPQGRVWPRIAQAGSVVIRDRDSQQSFGHLSANSLRFWLHD